MDGAWRQLPAAARAVAVATSHAVAAAQQRDADAFAGAVDELAALDAGQVSVVLGGTVRLLLEDLHPDGLDGDDVRGVLERCVASAAPWQPAVDPHVVLVVLAGALGVQDPDEQSPSPGPASLARHATLLIAGLLAERRRPLTGYLTGALSEIERAALHD